MTNLNQSVFSFIRRIRELIILFNLLSVQHFVATNATFQINVPELNEIILETERIRLRCFTDNARNPTFNVVNDQGTYVVKNNEAVEETGSFSWIAENQLNLQIVANALTKSSLTCQIFEDGNIISEEELFLDIRSKDQPACLMSTGPNVAIGDTIQVTCYEGILPAAVWRQTKDNGIFFVDLPTTESELINQFKRKYASSITVMAEDDGSVFECEVGGLTCRTDVITVGNGLMIEFGSQNPQPIKINEQNTVECVASQPTANVIWQHAYEARSDISVIPISETILFVQISPETNLTNGFILNFECIATLGQFEARATFQFVVDSLLSPKLPDVTEPRSTTKASTEQLLSTQTNPKTSNATTSLFMRNLTTIKTSSQTTERKTKSITEGTNGNSEELTLYFIIGGIAAIILVALIMLISVAICITHTNTPKKDLEPDRRQNRKNINTVSHIVEYSDGTLPSQYYTEVRKDSSSARVVSSPDVIPYSDVIKRHILIDEEEIYDETLNWGSEEI